MYQKNGKKPLTEFKDESEELLKERKYNRYGVDKDKLRKDINIINWDLIESKYRKLKGNTKKKLILFQTVYEYFCDIFNEQKKGKVRIVWNGVMAADNNYSLILKFQNESVFTDKYQRNSMTKSTEESALETYNELMDE